MSGLALAQGSKVAMDEDETAAVGGFGQFFKVSFRANKRAEKGPSKRLYPSHFFEARRGRCGRARAP